LQEDFHRFFGDTPRLFRAPGRVNLIGEHTDYNDGFVLPMAIDLAIWVAISPRNDRKLLVRSENYPDTAEIDLDGAGLEHTRDWSDYVRGVAAVLEDQGNRLPGANILIAGEVPIGSGLSSSAAIEVASGYALLSTTETPIDRVQLALDAQRAEHEYVGTRCGIMDQFVSANGKAGQALLLDTRSLHYELVPVPDDVRIVISNTMVKHTLANSDYNSRREECEAAVRHLQKTLPEIKALRDVTITDLERYRAGLSEVLFRRSQHVITENARVQQAAKALQQHDLHRFGALMYASHRSLRDDYEVSCPELDLMVELASSLPGVYGARMTGGGFGGCTVNLVAAEYANVFSDTIRTNYSRQTAITPDVYITVAADGAQEIAKAATRPAKSA
jgi:galactokinase